MLNFKKEYRHPALNPLQKFPRVAAVAVVADSEEPEPVAAEQEAAASAAVLSIPVSAVAEWPGPASDMAVVAHPARHLGVFRLLSR